MWKLERTGLPEVGNPCRIFRYFSVTGTGVKSPEFTFTDSRSPTFLDCPPEEFVAFPIQSTKFVLIISRQGVYIKRAKMKLRSLNFEYCQSVQKQCLLK